MLVAGTCPDRITNLGGGPLAIRPDFQPTISVELTGVPDGVYWLTSTANPLGVFLESDYDNNTAS